MCLLRSSGRLGIGTTAPTGKLEVNATNTIARFTDGMIFGAILVEYWVDKYFLDHQRMMH
jgi:hypothetical protein